jgi:hypothetical protein
LVPQFQGKKSLRTLFRNGEFFMSPAEMTLKGFFRKSQLLSGAPEEMKLKGGFSGIVNPLQRFAEVGLKGLSRADVPFRGPRTGDVEGYFQEEWTPFRGPSRGEVLA